MLIRFVISNFLSFHEEKEFNMLAGSFRIHKHHVYNRSKLNILKGAAVYGANGAGKSNLVKAIDFFQSLVKNGKLDKSVNSKKFKLDKESLLKPVELEIEFSYKRKVYAYGLSINGNIIEKEWLYISGIKTEDKLIFERRSSKNKKPSVALAKRYSKKAKTQLLVELMEDNLLKNNELLLGKSESFKITDIDNVREWIAKHLIIIYPDSKPEGLGALAFPFIMKEDFADTANELLSTFDTGIKRLGVESIDFDLYFGEDDEEFKNGLLERVEDEEIALISTEQETLLITRERDKTVVKKVIAVHNTTDNDNVNFNLAEESDGTRRLLDFIPAFIRILNLDITFIIDEIDQSLHPTLLYALVKKIMDDKTTKGQLIFTTHESNLLDLNIFRQDEIWFAEKAKTGDTQLYSLSEFKPRYDLDIRKGYLKGRFGAIPSTINLKKLNWAKHDA